MKISKKILLEVPQTKVFDFLNDMQNHEKLMPTNLISDWKADFDTCSFKLKNMLRIDLKINNRTPNTLIQAIPAKEAPISVNLQWEIKAVDHQKCEAIYTIEADINMMMQMVAKPILTQLIDYEIQTLAQIIQN